MLLESYIYEVSARELMNIVWTLHIEGANFD